MKSTLKTDRQRQTDGQHHLATMENRLQTDRDRLMANITLLLWKAR